MFVISESTGQSQYVFVKHTRVRGTHSRTQETPSQERNVEQQYRHPRVRASHCYTLNGRGLRRDIARVHLV